MTIGENIKRIRLSLGLSMLEFGRKFNPIASDSIISRWERGINAPNNERLKRIAELGGITVDELTSPTNYLHHVPLADLKAEIERRERVLEELEV